MQSAGGMDKAANGWEAGMELLSSGQADEAVAVLEPWVKANPDSFEGANYLGVALAQVGRQTEAVSALQRATRLHPQSAIAHFNLGVVFEKMGQPASARAEYQSAIQLDGKHTGAQVALAKLDTGFGTAAPAAPSGFEGTSWSTSPPATETPSASQVAERTRATRPNFLNVLGGFATGLVAAIVCAVIWDKLSYYTGFQIGYVAVGIGFVVGTAVVFGAGKKYGFSLQIIGALLSLFGVILGQTLLIMDQLRDMLAADPTVVGPSNLKLFFASALYLPQFYQDRPMSFLFAAIGLWCGWSAPAKPNEEQEYPEAVATDAPASETATALMDAPAATWDAPPATPPLDGTPRA